MSWAIPSPEFPPQIKIEPCFINVISLYILACIISFLCGQHYFFVMMHLSRTGEWKVM